jgi:hypothetical protein
VKLTQGTGRGICRWNTVFNKNVFIIYPLIFSGSYAMWVSVPTNYFAINKTDPHDDRFPESVTPIYAEDIKSITFIREKNFYFFSLTDECEVDFTNSGF